MPSQANTSSVLFCAKEDNRRGYCNPHLGSQRVHSAKVSVQTPQISHSQKRHVWHFFSHDLDSLIDEKVGQS